MKRLWEDLKWCMAAGAFIAVFVLVAFIIPAWIEEGLL